MVVIVRTSPRNIMNSREDERNESNHEYNFFLDKEIQKKLIAYDESSEEVLNHFRTNSGLTRAYAVKCIIKDDFCGWSAETSFRPKKPEKVVRPVQKEAPRWDTGRPAKEINYVFKHYRDSKDYMNQYRLEHTYNFGPLGKDGATVEIHTTRVTSNPAPQDAKSKQHPPRLKSHSDSQVRPTTPNGDTPRGDNNVLELAHKYKFAPHILRAAQVQSAERRRDNDDSDVQSTTKNRVSSASSQSRRRKSGKATALQPSKVPAIPPSPTGTSAGKQPRKSSPTANGTPFFQGKTMKHLPSNGYAIDSQAV